MAAPVKADVTKLLTGITSKFDYIVIKVTKAAMEQMFVSVALLGLTLSSAFI